MKNIIAAHVMLFCFVSCDMGGDYYEEMRRTAEAVEASPEDVKSWSKLLDSANSEIFWKRHFAWQFLVVLAPNQCESRKLILENLFKSGLYEADQGIRKLSVQGIRALGEQTIQECLPELIDLFRLKPENDTTWMIAKMFGTVRDPEKVNMAFDVLLEAVITPAPEEYPKNAPQLRRIALAAATDLGKLEVIEDVEAQFENLRNHVDFEFACEIDRAIKEVNSSIK